MADYLSFVLDPFEKTPVPMPGILNSEIVCQQQTITVPVVTAANGHYLTTVFPKALSSFARTYSGTLDVINLNTTGLTNTTYNPNLQLSAVYRTSCCAVKLLPVEGNKYLDSGRSIGCVYDVSMMNSGPFFSYMASSPWATCFENDKGLYTNIIPAFNMKQDLKFSKSIDGDLPIARPGLFVAGIGFPPNTHVYDMQVTIVLETINPSDGILQLYDTKTLQCKRSLLTSLLLKRLALFDRSYIIRKING